MTHFRVIFALVAGVWIGVSPALAQYGALGRELAPINGTSFGGITYAMDGTRLVVTTGPTGGIGVSVFDVASGDVVYEIEDRRAVVAGNGQIMATYGTSGELELRDIASGDILEDLSDFLGRRAEAPIFSDDDSLLLAGWRGRHAALIEVATGQIIQEFDLDDNDSRFTPVGLSSDGALVVTRNSNIFRVWSSTSGEISQVIRTGGGWAWGALTAQDQLVIGAEEQDFIEFHTLGTNSERRVSLGRAGYRSMQTNPEGTLAVLRQGRHVAVVDLDVEAFLYELQPRAGTETKTVAFSPDGELIAIGRAYGSVYVLAARTGAFVGFNAPHRSEVRAVAFSPDGDVIVSSSPHDIWMWSVDDASKANAPTPALMCVDTDPRGSFAPEIVLADGEFIVANRTRDVQVMDVASGALSMLAEGLSEPVLDIGLSGDGGRFFAWLANNSVEIRQRADGAAVSILGPHSYPLRDVILGPDGTRAMTVDREGIAALWDVDAGEELFAVINEEHPVGAVAMSDDGQFAAFVTPTLLLVYEAGSAETLANLRISTVPLRTTHLRFLPDNQLLIVDDAYHVQIIDWQAEQRIAGYTLDTEDRRIDFVRLSPDGRHYLHDAGSNTYVRDVMTGEVVTQITHEITVESARFDGSGARLLTASGDSTLRLWDVQSGEELVRFEALHGIMEDAIFLPGEAQVVGTGVNGNLCVFDVPAE